MNKKEFKPTALGLYLEKARMEKGLNLNQVQEATEISRQYIRAIEIGEKKIIGFDIIVRLSNVYGLDLNVLGKLVERGSYKRVQKNEE